MCSISSTVAEAIQATVFPCTPCLCAFVLEHVVPLQARDKPPLWGAGVSLTP